MTVNFDLNNFTMELKLLEDLAQTPKEIRVFIFNNPKLEALYIVYKNFERYYTTKNSYEAMEIYNQIDSI
jgi:hypothetical protein